MIERWKKEWSRRAAGTMLGASRESFVEVRVGISEMPKSSSETVVGAVASNVSLVLKAHIVIAKHPSSLCRYVTSRIE
jgi:uncharacterized protein (UPF0212 family)